MNRTKLVAGAVSALCLCLIFTQAAGAGLIIERARIRAVKGHHGGMQKQVSYFQDDKVKTVSEDGTYTILDLDKGTITTVNPAKGEYTTVSLKEMVSHMKESMRHLQERFKALPPEQRAMVEKMMGLQKEGPIELELKDAGKNKKIAGYPVHKYAIVKDGKEISEFWVSKRLRQDILKEINRSRLDDFEQAMNKISMEGLPFKGSEAQEVAKLEQKVRKYGEVMEEVHMPGPINHLKGDRFEVISVKKAQIPLSEFQIPKGYKKTVRRKN